MQRGKARKINSVRGRGRSVVLAEKEEVVLESEA